MRLATLTPDIAAMATGEWNGQALISQGTQQSTAAPSASSQPHIEDFRAMPKPALRAIEDIAEITFRHQIDLIRDSASPPCSPTLSPAAAPNKFRRAFDNFHNDGLNPNSWYNDGSVNARPRVSSTIRRIGRRPHFEGQLFFFGAFHAMGPGGYSTTQTGLLTSAASQATSPTPARTETPTTRIC